MDLFITIIMYGITEFGCVFSILSKRRLTKEETTSTLKRLGIEFNERRKMGLHARNV